MQRHAAASIACKAASRWPDWLPRSEDHLLSAHPSCCVGVRICQMQPHAALRGLSPASHPRPLSSSGYGWGCRHRRGGDSWKELHMWEAE